MPARRRPTARPRKLPLLEGLWQSSCLLDVLDQLLLHRQRRSSKIHQSEHHAEQHVPHTPISRAAMVIPDSVGWEQVAEAKVRRRQGQRKVKRYGTHEARWRLLVLTVTVTSLTTSTSAAPSTESHSTIMMGTER